MQRVVVVNSNGDAAQLDAAKRVTVTGGNGIGVSASDGVYTVSADPEQLPGVITAYRMMLENPYVSRLSSNGWSVTADESGTTWLFTDDCDSLELGPGMITVHNMCEPCSSCDTLYRLRQATEWYAMLLNEHKDVLLYDDDVVQARLAALQEGRTPRSADCKGDDRYVTVPYMKGITLLGQYAAMVHMWNYAVMNVNTDTRISALSWDPSGLLIQTKRSVTDCGGSSTISCEIRVSATTQEPGDPVSIYAPDAELSFAPFTDGACTDGDASIRAEHLTALDKKFSTDTVKVNCGGTFRLTAKLYPFVYCNTIDLSGNTVSVVSEKPDTSVLRSRVVQNGDVDNPVPVYMDQFAFGDYEYRVSTLTAPGREDYEAGRAYPSVTGSGSITWNVTVRWTVNVGNRNSVYEDSWIYRTSMPRVPLEEITPGTDLVRPNE